MKFRLSVCKKEKVLFMQLPSRAGGLPCRSSYCWPWWGCGSSSKCILPTSRSPKVQRWQVAFVKKMKHDSTHDSFPYTFITGKKKKKKIDRSVSQPGILNFHCSPEVLGCARFPVFSWEHGRQSEKHELFAVCKVAWEGCEPVRQCEGNTSKQSLKLLK